MLVNKTKRQVRHKRVRAKVVGDASKPRLCVFRSNQHIYAQLIDDANKKTLVSVKDADMKGKKSEIAKLVGMAIAEKAKEQKIVEVVFDRAGYQYHGRVKSLADGAREGGLKF
ncbi:MAG: 50S ribosomal protein L18 [Candidatus Pacebacteria bacterium]|nr:50S ribosomal protein L18 [Candidatus Paceibacterota bacterium]